LKNNVLDARCRKLDVNFQFISSITQHPSSNKKRND